MTRCIGRIAARRRVRDDSRMTILRKTLCVAAPVAQLSAALLAAAPAAETPPRYSEEDILNGTTIAIASQELCGYRVDEKAIRAFMAAKLPDLSPDLIALQLRGYARILPALNAEQRQRHCAETRQLAAVAGWLI